MLVLMQESCSVNVTLGSINWIADLVHTMRVLSGMSIRSIALINNWKGSTLMKTLVVVNMRVELS
jgi:hypothetical protein